MTKKLDIIEALNALGYNGKFLDNELIEQILLDGPKSELFREFITWIANEIHVLRNTDEKVGQNVDVNEFMLEISAFLKELGCPYGKILSGPVTGRLQTKESRSLLIDFLLTELMASRMFYKSSSEKKTSIVPVFENPTVKSLEYIAKELDMGTPPVNIPIHIIFDQMLKKLDQKLNKMKHDGISKPLFPSSSSLTDAQWKQLSDLQKILDEDYKMREQMLLTRLEVSVQSFQWSKKLKAKNETLISEYQNKSKDLEELRKSVPGTDIAALLAARTDVAIIEKTSNATVRQNTNAKIQKFVIGKVPDRGGRAYEHAPPPPEMPSWQKDRSGPPQGNRGGGGFNVNTNRGGGVNQDGGNHRQNNHNYRGNQRQQYEQRPQYEQRSQHDQRQQGGQAYGQNYQQVYAQNQQQPYVHVQHGGGGGDRGGRVQGSWSQRERNTQQRGNQNYQNQEYTGNYNDRRNRNRGGGGGGDGWPRRC